MNRNLNRRIHPIAEANGLSPKFHRKAEKSKSSVKAGRTAPKNVGGIINRKAVKISAKRKNG